jgi:PAS domain S-box-containing protein
MTTLEPPTGKTTTAVQREAGSPDPMSGEADRPPAAPDDALRRFSALSGDWFWVQDAQLRLTYMSSRMGEQKGLDLSAYLGAKRWEQPALNLSQADWERHREQIERHEPFKDFEIHCRADDGHTVWLSLSAQPLFDEVGAFSGYLGVGRDITGQKRVAQLQRLEHAVARGIAEGATISQSIEAMLRGVGEAEGWERADFWTVDEGAWVLRRTHGDPGDIALKPGEGLAGSVWQSGDPLWIADAVHDPRTMSALLPEETGLRARVLFPVRHGPRVVGVLELASRAIRAPEPRFLATLEALCHQVGLLLQRAAAEQGRRDSEARLRSLTNLSAD